MYYIGIDIGSTASKTVVYDGTEIIKYLTVPTGWSSKDTSEHIKNELMSDDIDVNDDNVKVVATGYGRISVEYADKVVTEITCHGMGGRYLIDTDCTVIDVGGQDTKIITVQNNMVSRFLMNDKCSAGTGKFIEIMANRLGLNIGELFDLAEGGNPVAISSMCTVFAESEVISHIGLGEKRTDIAAGVIESVVSKVGLLCKRHGIEGTCILTGGLSTSQYFADKLSENLSVKIHNDRAGRYAGAIGAALLCSKKFK